MIDTHAHLYMERYDEDRDAVIQRCKERLDALINIGIDGSTSRDALMLAHSHPAMFATIGYHPEEAAHIQSQHAIRELTEVMHLDEQKKIVAIGEIGLDYHLPNLDQTQKNNQRDLFEAQIVFALEHNLPVVIHSREATENTLSVLQEFLPNGLRGVWHSFTEGIEQAEQILSLGFYIGLNGIVTYPSARTLQHAVPAIPIDRILSETDAPFLAPQKFRGQRNEPWMVELVVEKIADCHRKSIDEVTKQIDHNARSLFNL